MQNKYIYNFKIDHELTRVLNNLYGIKNIIKVWSMKKLFLCLSLISSLQASFEEDKIVALSKNSSEVLDMPLFPTEILVDIIEKALALGMPQDTAFLIHQPSTQIIQSKRKVVYNENKWNEFYLDGQTPRIIPYKHYCIKVRGSFNPLHLNHAYHCIDITEARGVPSLSLTQLTKPQSLVFFGKTYEQEGGYDLYAIEDTIYHNEKSTLPIRAEASFRMAMMKAHGMGIEENIESAQGDLLCLKENDHLPFMHRTRASYELATIYYENKEYILAYNTFKSLETHENQNILKLPLTCFFLYKYRLAMMRYYGLAYHGLPGGKEYRQARNTFEWLETHENQGSLKLSSDRLLLYKYHLAMMRSSQQGGPRDSTKARKAFEELENIEFSLENSFLLKYTLYKMYYQGIGGDKNYEAARRGFEFIAIHGQEYLNRAFYVTSRYILARMQYKAKGGSQDLESAYKGFQAVKDDVALYPIYRDKAISLFEELTNKFN